MGIDTTKLSDVDIYKLILQGKVKRFPDRFWTKPGALDSAREITQYFIEELLKWDDISVKKNLTEMVFRKHKLSGMLEYVFGRSPFKALDNAYPGKYKEWELKHVSKNLWNNSSKREDAINWLLNKVKKNSFEELTNIDFINNGLGGLLDRLYKKDYFKELDKESIKLEKKYTQRILKVSFNKSGGTAGKGGLTTRITLPTSWIKEMGLTEENREVIAKLQNGKIIIEPKKKNN